ncbi:MAG: adenylosuccinate lyase [Actinomycetota bacterium]|nr:adenylosuccinate lyase [Actinomycetota bacterium]
MPDHDVVPNVLASRYASPALRGIWSPRARIMLERRFWLTVLRAQREHGVDVPDEVVTAYEAAIEDVDLDAIEVRERETRHDVKARIDEFSARAATFLGGPSPEHIHKALTSRDVTDNVEQIQIRRSLELVRDRIVAGLARLAERAAQHELTPVVARTHNVPAQVTTVGKRFSNAGQELLVALRRLEELLSRYPLRGLKGPVGTQQDLLDLLGGDAERLEDLEVAVAHQFGFSEVLVSVGQIYPRSLDLDVLAALTQAASGPANLATSLRLMAGNELVTEGFTESQIGSSAMPHKMNPRSCERISGFRTLLSGYLAMVAGLTGEQWNEGDVSCSVVRRVALPDAFFAIDGLFETFLTVLDELAVHPLVVERELRRYLPFLATAKVLVASLRKGVGREQAHAAIREHAVAVSRGLREGRLDDNDLLARLAADDRIPLGADELADLIERPLDLVGTARRQVGVFISAVEQIAKEHSEAAVYTPGAIL